MPGLPRAAIPRRSKGRPACPESSWAGRPDPFKFYLTFRLCPNCRGRLLTATPLTRTFTQGPLQSLGITCYCVRCNRRYRAVSGLRFWWVAWLGPVGRWLWWQTTSLEVTLQGEFEESD